jgi:hypothetical protein
MKNVCSHCGEECETSCSSFPESGKLILAFSIIGVLEIICLLFLLL